MKKVITKNEKKKRKKKKITKKEKETKKNEKKRLQGNGRLPGQISLRQQVATCHLFPHEQFRYCPERQLRVSFSETMGG